MGVSGECLRVGADGAVKRLLAARAAWRRPLDVTDLGAFGPKVLLLGASAQNTPPGCICGGGCARR